MERYIFRESATWKGKPIRGRRTFVFLVDESDPAIVGRVGFGVATRNCNENSSNKLGVKVAEARAADALKFGRYYDSGDIGITGLKRIVRAHLLMGLVERHCRIVLRKPFRWERRPASVYDVLEAFVMAVRAGENVVAKNRWHDLANAGAVALRNAGRHGIMPVANGSSQANQVSSAFSPLVLGMDRPGGAD